jgi:hypothetical protein
MSDCKSCETPGSNYDTKEDELFEDVDLYQQAIGSLIYLSVATRPDISFSVNLLARNLSKPTKNNWIGVKRIFRYLKGTLNYGLVYKKKSYSLIGYSDASHADDDEDRKSSYGYVFLINGGAISWCARKLKCITLSSMESEYCALTDAVKEGKWLSIINKELYKDFDAIKINEDNQSAIKFSNNKMINNRSKHIDIKYHFVRENVLAKKIILEYCPTDQMTADIFTKSLGKLLFRRHRDALGVVSCV